MLAAISFAFGILLAIIVLAVTRRRQPQASGSTSNPTHLGWYTFGFGLIAVTAFVLGLWLTPGDTLPGLALGLLNLSIALAVAAVWVGVGAFRRRDRQWPTWVGLVAGLVPAVLWIAFAAGNVLGSGG